jgi:hypothetical protein
MVHLLLNRSRIETTAQRLVARAASIGYVGIVEVAYQRLEALLDPWTAARSAGFQSFN